MTAHTAPRPPPTLSSPCVWCVVVVGGGGAHPHTEHRASTRGARRGQGRPGSRGRRVDHTDQHGRNTRQQPQEQGQQGKWGPCCGRGRPGWRERRGRRRGKRRGGVRACVARGGEASPQGTRRPRQCAQGGGEEGVLGGSGAAGNEGARRSKRWERVIPACVARVVLAVCECTYVTHPPTCSPVFVFSFSFKAKGLLCLLFSPLCGCVFLPPPLSLSVPPPPLPPPSYTLLVLLRKEGKKGGPNSSLLLLPPLLSCS